MEEWQTQHIYKNLPALIRLTEFSLEIQAELLANRILCDIDIDILNAKKNHIGKLHSAKLYYELLMQRTNAYKVLTKALVQYNQTGAARILIDGVPIDLIEKPLTYLGISTKLDDFQDVEIEVNEKTLKLCDFLPGWDHQRVENIFRANISEVDFYHCFVRKDRIFVLGQNTVPHAPPVYISRSLSNRIKLNSSIFKTNSLDVFVFKNTIERFKLSQIIYPNLSVSSYSQLFRITSRFIYLNKNEDWHGLRKLAETPIHLINYEAGTFILEDTSSPSEIIKQVGSEFERFYISEDEFVKQQISGDTNARSSIVYICDTPGMGKTFLLASIARRMSENFRGRVVVFIPLSTFIVEFSPNFLNNTSKTEAHLLNLLKYMSSSQQNQKLLIELIQANFLLLELFLDGFDEIPSSEVEWAKQVFNLIMSDFPKVRIYTTSRPHMRNELEEGFGGLAYNILSFHMENQTDFLVQIWSKNLPNIDNALLKKHAISCLDKVKKCFTQEEKEFTGIPLLCKLIAEVFVKEVASTSFKEELCYFPHKISEMYQTFVKQRLYLIANNQTEFDNIKLAHTWHALKLLFPTHDFHEEDQFKNVIQLTKSPKLLKSGIIQKYSNAATEFMHRTLAEYFVADFFSKKFQDLNQDCNVLSILKMLLKGSRWGHLVSQSVVVYFLECALSEIDYTKNINALVDKDQTLTSISPEEFNSMMCACFHRDASNIFSILKEAMLKFDKPWIEDYLQNGFAEKLLLICIRRSTTKTFYGCIQLFTEVLEKDVTKYPMLLKAAAKHANYEALEYCVGRAPLKGQLVLEYSVSRSYFEDLDTVKTRENILHLLLNKDPSLLNENPNILFYSKIHLKLIKILIKYGAQLTTVNKFGENIALALAEYMSPNDYFDFVEFVVNDCKADFLFREYDNWNDPLPKIIERCSLLPHTLDLLFEVSGMNTIMKKDKLLFCAVAGNNINNLQQLVNHGLDVHTKTEIKQNLLHVAAETGNEDIVQYLLSLKLDPNIRDDNGETPLHCTVKAKNGLPVIKMLVESGANLETKNRLGQTLLQLAVNAETPNEGAIKYLVEKGLEVKDRNKNSDTTVQFRTEVKKRILKWTPFLLNCIIILALYWISK